MANLWYTIPKLTTVDRGTGNEKAVSISQGFGEGNPLQALGMDGAFTLNEAEDLLWRMKQAVHLLKLGRLPPNHP